MDNMIYFFQLIIEEFITKMTLLNFNQKIITSYLHQIYVHKYMYLKTNDKL